MVVAVDIGSGTPLVVVWKRGWNDVKLFVTVLHLGAVSSSVFMCKMATGVMCIRLAVNKILLVLKTTKLTSRPKPSKKQLNTSKHWEVGYQTKIRLKNGFSKQSELL